MLTLALTLTSAHAQRPLKVYMKGGLVDKVQMGGDASVGHSRTDLNGTVHDDYVSMVITDVEGRERHYLISQLDSLVLPTGRRVVFHGYSNVNENENENQNENENKLPPYRGGLGRGFKRTSFEGQFPGQGERNVRFKWTEYDRIRLEDGSMSRATSLTADRTGAEFVFDDAVLEAPEYTVYYPDRMVTIASQQTQRGVNNSDHIGPSGDCGMAIATIDSPPSGGGAGGEADSYSFTLEHQAAYLCFLPRIDYLPSVRVTQIDVTCSSGIAGTFELTPRGLVNGKNTSTNITLTLSPQQEHDFFLGHVTDNAQQMCGSYMVIAPQSSTRTFTVTYHLTDTLSRFTTTYEQTLSDFKPLANTVYPITCHIPESLFRSIDLGYGYKWSNVNLGSNLPNEAGDYYTWQATHGAMTDGWQMPTEDAKNELLKCTWTWGMYNGAEGWLIEGTNNGNDDIGKPRIFIPLTGYKDGSSMLEPNKGYYWMDTGWGSESEAQYAVIVSHDENTRIPMPSSLAMNTRPVKAVDSVFRIPYSGTQTIDLRTHGPGDSIKVYDDGGPSGNYSGGYNGHLRIMCAEDYKLNVNGSVYVEGGNCDYVTITDVGDGNKQLLHSKENTKVYINVTSESNIIDIYFKTDGSVDREGIDFNVTIQKKSLKYQVNINNVVGGTMTADVDEANPEDTVMLTAVPADGYMLHYITVETEGKVLTLYEDDPKLNWTSSAGRHYLMCDTVRVRDGNWYHDVSHFLMPYSNVTVTPHFVNTDDPLYVTMAGRDTVFVERKYIQRLLDNGMTKFRFYDHGGPNGNYGNDARGYMYIDAPIQYHMQVSGNLDMEGCEKFYIYDGKSRIYHPWIETNGSSSFSCTTNNNDMFLYFESDGSVVKSGYEATVTLVYDDATQYNIPLNSTKVLTEQHINYLLGQNVTSMPVYSASGTTAYACYSDGSLRFLMPEGYQVRVSGTVGTESGYDWLKVYDAGVEKKYLSGSTKQFSYTCESRDLRLKFHSDGSGVGDNKMELTVDFIAPTPSGD